MKRAVTSLHVRPVLSAEQKKDLRAELKAVVEKRQEAAGGAERPRYKFEADHLFSCWLITCLLMQFFGTRNLGDLSPADKLWLITTVKKLHNGFKSIMMVDTSRNQWHIWLNLLLAMGCSFDVIRSGWTL